MASIKRSNEMVHDPASSPTKLRQISNSPFIERKFNKPMSFTAAGIPSPSRDDIWKKELGLSDEMNNSTDFVKDDNTENENPDSRTDVEFNVLKSELQKKDRQKDQLLLNIKSLKSTIDTFKAKLAEGDDIHRGNTRIMKTTFQAKLKEKEELVQNLRTVVDEMQIKLQQSVCKQDSEITFNISNLLQPLVAQINSLTDQKSVMTQKISNYEKNIAKLQNNYASLMDTLKTEYVTKKDYDTLLQENRTVKEALDKIRATTQLTVTEKINSQDEIIKKYDIQSKDLLQLTARLKEFQELSKARDEAQLAKCKHYEEDIAKYKKKTRDIELRYTTLACTPPKLHLRKIPDENTEHELEEIREERHKQYNEILSLQRKITKLNESNEELSKQCIKHESSVVTLMEKCKMLQKDKENLESFRIQHAEEVLHSKKLQQERDEKENEIETLVKEMHDREKTLKENMVNQIKDAIMKTESKYEGMNSNYKNIIQRMKELHAQLKDIRQIKMNLESDVKNFQSSLQPALNYVQLELCNTVFETNKRSQVLTQKYRREIKLRKRLHNELIDLKGNIRVFCRVRPVIEEDGDSVKSVVTCDGDDDTLVALDHKNSIQHFDLDKVFGPAATQEEVFEDIQNLVTSCLDGYNVCIFAYGQTGSGKTYTMEGTETNPGVNQRTLSQLFYETEQQIDWEYTILVDFVEIYNEMLRDLLSVEPTAKLEIKQTKEGLSIPGLTRVKVNSAADVNQVFSLGRHNRMTAATNMNKQSSRSHSILTITVFGKNINTGTKVHGKMNLVDLAGSERISKSGSEGARMKEAQNINKSLSALGDVIHSLKNKQAHIPYRNTKLTYLLQDSLGGDSKTLMVVQVSSVEKNARETYCSLNFAQRVRSVELGKATAKKT